MMNTELLKAQKELLAHTFSQAIAYTNTIVLAGYASFFAIWNFTKPHLSHGQILWSALLVCISLMSFVAFEVYGMISRNRSLHGLVKAVRNPQQFETLLQAHKENEQSRIIVFSSLWHVSLIISVTSGFSAAGILIWAFIVELFKLYW